MATKRPRKFLPSLLVTAVFVALGVGGVAKLRSGAEAAIQTLQKNHTEWFNEVTELTKSVVNREKDFFVMTHKDRVLEKMPPEVAMVVVEGSGVPMLSARFPKPGAYRVLLTSDWQYWLTYGAFMNNGAQRWSRVLSTWIEPEKGKRYRVVMFMEK